MQAAQDMLTPAKEIDIPFVPKSGALSSAAADEEEPVSVAPVRFAHLHIAQRTSSLKLILKLDEVLTGSLCWHCS
jgi:hypothetical protein